MTEKFCVNIGSLSIRAPFTIPSGIVTTVPSVIARLAEDIHELGFLTTKSISLEPRLGNREPVLHEYHPGCFANAVGLANPGAASFIRSMTPLLPLSQNKPLVISIMGSSHEEFLECAKVLEPLADAFELNLSCPHVKDAGQSIGSDPEFVKILLNMLREKINRPLIPKLSPNLVNFDEMVTLCEQEGADALCLINTVGPGTVVDREGTPILTNINGGLSGSAIKPLGLKLVRQAAALVRIPIIACGGIASASDVHAYKKAGASLFGIGSSLALIETLKMPAFFENLATGLEATQDLAKSRHSIQSVCRTDYFKAGVVANRKIAENMFQIVLAEESVSEPGQFYFLRIPGVGEKPFSPLSSNPLSFLVRAVGPFTTALQNLGAGEEIHFRGPYGNGFPKVSSGKPLVMLGGGTGAGPIIMAAKKLSQFEPKVFLGFSSDVDPDALRDIGVGDLNLVVEIDKPGIPGEIVKCLSHKLTTQKRDFMNALVFMCGPFAMMELASLALKEVTSPSHIYMAREDIMKCGIGICGSCGTPSGMRSCVDGPVMSLE